MTFGYTYAFSSNRNTAYISVFLVFRQVVPSDWGIYLSIRANKLPKRTGKLPGYEYPPPKKKLRFFSGGEFPECVH